MSDFLLDVLRMLRVFGPCSNADVGRKLGIAPDKTYRAIQELERRGLIYHPKKQRWDISELGRDWFARNGLNTLELYR